MSLPGAVGTGGRFRPASNKPAYPHFGGFESTHIYGTGEDILGTTRHIEYWREDLSLLLDAGITSLRYSIPWHRIERRRGEFDWSWMDDPMAFMHAAGMSPVVDPLHHTSFPDWLENGFLHPEFPALYQRFLEQIWQRYGWVHRYTVMNEPLPTTLFCSYTGMWYPHRASDRDFVAMALQVAKAISLGTSLLASKTEQMEFVYVSTAEHHCATDMRTANWVEHVNHRRFLILDLILGRVDRHHPLYIYLQAHGGSDEDLAWLRDNPASFQTLGLDYYLHSEMDWFWNKERQTPDIAPFVQEPRGFASIAKDYEREFECPLMLSETNIRGTVGERITWLKFMEEQCEQLAHSSLHEFRGFCWYPSIDSTDWSNACTRCTREVDPQGIWMLDASRTTRHASELSEIYGMLAQGKIRSGQIRAQAIGEELARRLEGYVPLLSGMESRSAGVE